MDGAMEDIWLRKATTAAIAAARKVVEDGAVNPAAPVGQLSDVELGVDLFQQPVRLDRAAQRASGCGTDR